MALINTNIGPERVQVFDVPLGVVQLPGSPTSVTAFLIYTTEMDAPTDQAVRCTDLSQVEDNFGGPDEIAHNAYYAIQGFFDNAGIGNTAIIVAVAADTTNAFVGSATDSSGLRALDSQEDLGLVCIPGLPLSMSYAVHPALIDYTETVRAEFGSTLSTSYSLAAIPVQISQADSDEEVVVGPYDSVTGTGPYVIQLDPTDLSDVTPGMIVENDAQTFTGVISALDDTLNTVTVLQNPGAAFTGGADVNILIPSAVKYKDVVVNQPSRVSAWYFNNPIVTDRSTSASPGDAVTVDPTGHVAGVIARIDANIAIGGPSHAPAGIQFAGLAGILGLSLRLSERTDAEPLRLAFINRITSFAGSGNIIFGGYSAGGSAVTADEQLIQVMRTLQYIKASLEKGLRGFLWENFSPDTQTAVERSILSFLRNNVHLFPAGLPEAQQFKVVRVEATQDDLDQGVLRVRVLVRPNKAVRFIEIALEFPLPTA